eukprot:scaffold5807_cov114-Skeletonema_dohrnii-CCMP3373.AAC.4
MTAEGQEEVEMAEESFEAEQSNNNFTPIQSRKLRRTTLIPCMSLCPSMDLIALGTGSSAYKFDLVEGSPSKRRNNSNSDSDGEGPSVDFAESIDIHRIVSWQRLLSLTPDQLTSSKFNDDDDDLDSSDSIVLRENKEWEYAEDGGGPLFQRLVSSEDEMMDDTNNNTNVETSLPAAKGATFICWSPDGRCVAIGLVDGGVLIHDVEPEATDDDAAQASGHHALHIIHPPPPQQRSIMANLLSFNEEGNESDKVEEQAATSEEAEPSRKKKVAFSPRVTRSMASRRGDTHLSSVQQQTIDEYDDDMAFQPTSAVIGMSWNRVSPPHSSWSLEKEEWEMKESWAHSSQLIDRGRYFLPSDCFNTFKSSDKARVDGSFSPLAHLNVLCVATSSDLHWYLQGRYRIGSIPHGFDIGGHNTGIDLVCSPDLTSLLVISKQPQLSKGSRVAALYTTPLLGERRFDMQIFSALYRSIFSRLRDIREGIRSSTDSWRLALRPLDAKFQGLFKLLCNYNVAQPNDSVVDCAAAIRLELLRCILSGRSSVSGDASNALDQFFTRPQMHDQLFQREIKSVEASVASMEAKLRSKILAPIRALVYETDELYGIARSRDCDASSSTLIDPEEALRLYTFARILFLAFERCLAHVVEARGRLHDLLAWIRGTASQVRARGTATDSIQRQNARNRRVPDGVIRRVSNFLSTPMISAVKDSDDIAFEHRHLAECVIGVPLSDFFSDCVSTDKVALSSKMSVRCTLKSALQSAFQTCAVLFDKPRDAFTETLARLDIHFETPHSILAAHSRIGAGPRADKNEAFEPKMIQPNDSSLARHWMIIVRSVQDNFIEVIAIPGNVQPKFYLQAGLALPDNHTVRNIQFYGDSGNSSLSPNLDIDAVTNEGRQSLGLIIERQEVLSDGSEELNEELWVFKYDEIFFEKFDLGPTSDKAISIAAADFNRENCVRLQTCRTSGEDDDNVLVTKCRHICTHQNLLIREQTKLNLCGSRGTAGVLSFGASTSLDILDLEEDEEDDEDDSASGDESFEE